MIYPSTVALQEVVTFTYRAPVFDLPGRGLGGLTPRPHCRRTTSPLELVWGIGFDPPDKFQWGGRPPAVGGGLNPQPLRPGKSNNGAR